MMLLPPGIMLHALRSTVHSSGIDAHANRIDMR
jgi:hypothetical protein